MRVLQPPGWPQPKGYSNGVLGQGRLLVTGGLVGWDENEQFASDDFVDQVRQALSNTLAVLAEGGAGPEHIARMTWYVTDKQDYLTRLPELGKVYREVMGRHFPAMAMVQVAALIEDRAKVEIETTALVPEPANRPAQPPAASTPSAKPEKRDALFARNELIAWLQLLKASKSIERRIGGAMLIKHKTSITRFDVLANLERCPGRHATISGLSQMLLGSQGNITRLLDRMEEDRLIQRQEHPGDRRISDVHLTRTGAELFARLAPDHAIWTHEVFGTLNKAELLELIRLLRKLRQRLNEALPGEGGV